MPAQPPASARARADEAGLMWLDDADLMSVSEPRLELAADSGSVFAKCILPSLGLFAAVLFGHVILAASQLAAPSAVESHTALAPAPAPQPAAAPVVEPAAPPAAASDKAAEPEPSKPAAPRETRSHRQYEDGAQGSGANGVDKTQPGLLRINSRPWAQVTLDGNALGNTPLLDVQVTPGAHTLRLDNPDFQVSKTISVEVAPGETVTRVVSLEE